LQLEMPYDRDRHEENPNIGNEVTDVCEVCELDQAEAFRFDIGVPKRLNRSTGDSERDGYTNDPSDNKCYRCEDYFAE
jgi:hypothetical protein